MYKLTVRGTPHTLPLFFPDATLGVVRGLSSEQVAAAGIEGVVINTYHLMTRPGAKLLDKAGGIRPFMHWDGLTASDSGGFQLFSLIHENPKLGKITDEGVVLYSSQLQRKKTLFTPEDSIRIQFAIGSDIMICLDDFSPVDGTPERLRESVERTTAWAARCKKEFERQCKKRQLTKRARPLLLAVVQGHRDAQLRRQSARELINIGFDGYGFGGWPFTDQGKFDYTIAQVVADATPNNCVRFALGVGSPADIVRLRQMGYDIFDCVLPTRDARHQRLYTFTKDPAKIDFSRGKWWEYLYLDRGSLATDFSPVSAWCDCELCTRHSRAYLHHLFKIKDALAYRLATTHNLRMYALLMQALQEQNKL
jgi:queuine tRNA-ribosyltransferase